MQKYKSNITTTSGAAVRNVPVHVLAEDGSNAAIFLDRAGTVPASNPLITAADGTFYFYAVNGRYSLRTTVEGVTITDADVVLLMDPEEITVVGPIADAIHRAESAAQQAEAAVQDSGIPDLVASAKNAVIDAQSALSAASGLSQDAQDARAAAISAGQASAAAGQAASDAQAAVQAAVAVSAAAIRAYATRAEAAIAAALLPDGADVEVSQDETRAGARTRYKVQAGALVFVVNLDQVRLDLANAADPAKGAGMVGYLPSGVGAVGRNVQSKLREFVSVKDFGAVGDGVADDTTAVQAAVTHCFTSGDQLYWPDGTYLTTASISNFHSVRHGGAGAVRIGGLLWRFDLAPTDINVLHVMNAGNDSNDGLASTGRALKTIQRALDILSNIGASAANGRWRIQLGAEVYDQTAMAADLPNFTNMLEFRGVLAAVPLWTSGQTVEAGDYRISGDGNMLYRAESHGVTGPGRPLQPYGVSSDGNVMWRYIGGDRPWAASQAVGLHRYRQNAGNLYYAIPGTGDASGATPPTHTSGNVSDGGTVWQYLGPHLPIPTRLPATRIRGALNAPLLSATLTVKAGDPRRHGDRIYIAMASGSVGTIAPTHTSGIAATDGVAWKYIGAADESLGNTGIWIQPGTRVNLYGLAFSQFQSSMFGDYGFLMENKDFLLTQNCIFENNSIAIGAIGHVTHTMQNCLVVSNGKGPFTTYNSKIAIGTRADTGCFLVNNDTGAYISRGTIAHCDFAGLSNNRNGLTVSILSRVHCLGSQFRGNDKPLWVIGGGEWVNNPSPKNCFFWGKEGTGNAEAPRQDGFSRIDNVHDEQSQAEIRYYRSFTDVAVPAGTGEQLAHQANRNLPVDWFLDNSKKLRVVVTGTFTGTAGTKRIRAALGGSAIASIEAPAETTGAFIFEAEVAATGFNTQKSRAMLTHHLGVPRLSVGNSVAAPVLDARGDNVELPLRIYTTLAGVGDTVTIRSVEWFITG